MIRFKAVSASHTEFMCEVSIRYLSIYITWYIQPGGVLEHYHYKSPKNALFRPAPEIGVAVATPAFVPVADPPLPDAVARVPSVDPSSAA